MEKKSFHKIWARLSYAYIFSCWYHSSHEIRVIHLAILISFVSWTLLSLAWHRWNYPANHGLSIRSQHTYSIVWHFFHAGRILFFNVLSQWETTLHCNVVSHWLGAYTQWFLCWLHDMEPFSSIQAFYEGIDPRCKGIVITNFYVSFVFNLHMLSSNQSSWWFDSNDACVIVV